MKVNKISTSIIVFFILFFGASHAFALNINLDFSQSIIMPGDSFSIDVNVTDTFSPPFSPSPPNAVIAFGFDIVNTDPSVFAFQSASVNYTLFMDDSSLFPDTDVAGSAFPPVMSPDFTFRLATLNFTALAIGRATVGIFSDLNDPNEGLRYLNTDSKIQTVLDITTPVPEPGTIILIGSGLLGLAGIKRKIKKS
jgi:hypothetical protein